MQRPLVFLALSAFMVATPALAATSAADLAKAGNPQDRAFLPVEEFRNGVANWQADGRDALYIESTGGSWYHVQLMQPCLNLPYTTIINFVTDGPDRLDEFSSILVRGQRCWFKSADMSDAPAEANQ